MNIAYERLFGVRLLHNFYLAGKDGSSFFSLDENDPANRLKIGRRLLDYDVRRDFVVEPTLGCAKLLKNYRMIFKADAQGFIVGVSVDPRLAGRANTVVRLPLPEGARMAFTVRLKNPAVQNFTNMRLAALPVPFRYYFSNEDGGHKIYPSLSTPVGLFDAGARLNGGVFEMGEYCRLKKGGVSEAVSDAPDQAPANWQNADDEQLAHTGDRRAAAKKFSVRFLENGAVRSKILSIAAELEKIPGTLNTIQSAAPMDSALLDFSTYEISDPASPSGKRRAALPDGRYSLKMSGDFALQTPVYLFDALEDSNVWGIIEIVNNSGFPNSFRLQNADATLPAAAPMFQIRLQSRLVYRRYLDNNAKVLYNLFLSQPFPGFSYDADAGVLAYNQPQRLIRAPADLKIGDLTLPEPPGATLARDQAGGKFISTIPY